MGGADNVICIKIHLKRTLRTIIRPEVTVWSNAFCINQSISAFAFILDLFIMSPEPVVSK